MALLRLTVLASIAAAASAAWTCEQVSITPVSGFCANARISGNFCVQDTTGIAGTAENMREHAENNWFLDTCRQGAALFADCQGIGGTLNTNAINTLVCGSGGAGSAFCTAASIADSYGAAPCASNGDCQNVVNNAVVRPPKCCNTYTAAVNVMCTTPDQGQIQSKVNAGVVCKTDNKGCYNERGVFTPSGAPSLAAGTLLAAAAAIVSLAMGSRV
mmetsp:Transcript_26062/g.64362  ORF Transcript_26062/g.64362 Transcript_26062/m.64362 type:complete len:216 (+) Transcript_26062:71-718(+)|eukprot:CAMPEP_0206244024 /NCGR_PEP_ID=MMETSP0047_2-20121206/17926_1 /ASSEMBLY_ACC=CAM_ASM_000192 /TAXON_ID=195065 /ORGANISM="Chroomonas mesostigmatica_cf, Strain CCMP1168" /LENGTH=215 /DNA_ID=CAMNT_0053669195 /DNA_START=63 /DNA_END=710 /DNA_ORIENTATION=-